jgi:enamine deaminase RidA (YjgF/YER057c/UK114 family)
MSTTIVKPMGISPPTGTYSHGVLVPPGTQLFFVAGQVPIAVDGSVPRDFTEQTELVWHNIRTILASADMTLENVVKMQGFITNAVYRDRYRAVRDRMLGPARPASTLVVVVALGQPEWCVEIEAVAAGPV